MRELTLRVRSVLRRSKSEPMNEEHIAYGDLEMNSVTKTCLIAGEEVALTKKEFEILKLFLQNRGRIFTRDEILDRVWEEDVLVIDRTIDVNINRLRKKIGRYGNNIVTKLGYGYGFKE